MFNNVSASAGAKQNLQEIPLAEGGVKDMHEDDNQQESFLKELERSECGRERKLKSNSLKRFFRMPPKKSSEPTEMQSAEHNVNIGEQIPTEKSPDDNTDAAVAIDSDANREPNKRFKLRLGGMLHYSNSKEGESKIDLNDSASKATLKSSLSSYWSSVFKKKKSKSFNDMERTEVVTTTNFLETLDQEQPQQSSETPLVQGIHILQISDDSN